MKTCFHSQRAQPHRVSLLSASLVAIFPLLGVQASHAEPAVAELKEVVIRASSLAPLPQAAGQIDQELLNHRRASVSDTARLLQDTPGMSVYGAGGVSSRPVIRGLGGDRLRIKVDGMDLIASCPNHMNPALSYIDPAHVGTLTVYAGITPVSVGGDSIGGTIIAETPAPAFAAPGEGRIFKGEVGAFYRSNGKARGGNLSATYATESFNMSYAGATAQASNHKAARDFKTTTWTGRVGHALPLDEVGSTAYETRNHTLGFAWRGEQHLVEANLGHQNIPYQLYPNQRMDMLDSQQNRLNLRYLGQFGWGTLEARAYHEKVDHFMDFGVDKRFWYGTLSGAAGVACAPIRFMGDSAGTCASGMPMHTEGKTTGATVKADITLSQQDLLRVGGDVQRYRLNDWWPASGSGMGPGTFLNINDGERDRTALFVEWEGRMHQQWMGLFGVRYERVKSDAGDVRGYRTTAGAPGNQIADAERFNARNRERTDNNWDVSALARYTVDATRDIELGFARKVRSPNLYERYTWSTWPMAAIMNNFAGDGNGYIGNLDLKPETAHTLSATFNWHAPDRSWGFKATPYYTRITDYIDAVRCTAAVIPGSACPATSPATNQFLRLQYVNQSARIYGLELSGHMPLATTGWGEFDLRGLLNYSRGKNLTTGDNLYHMMPLNARLVLDHKAGRWTTTVEAELVAAKDRVNRERNELQTTGYGLAHVRASYALKRVRFDFGIENLFDRFYNHPLGGAYMGQGTTMSATAAVPAWGTPVAGAGRTFYAGVNVQF